MTTPRTATLVAAFTLAATAFTPAIASPRPTAWNGLQPYGVETTGSLDAAPGSLFRVDRDPATCPMSSAAEGNANQQHFPVKQYGQTAGGNRC